MITVTKKVHFVTKGRWKRITKEPCPEQQIPPARIPRISRLMALAIRFDKLISDGHVKDMSALARLAQVSQPRMTQIMNLNHLAPDIQEELLHLPPVAHGRDQIHEKMLRTVCANLIWARQRDLWHAIRQSAV